MRGQLDHLVAFLGLSRRGLTVFFRSGIVGIVLWLEGDVRRRIGETLGDIDFLLAL